MPVASTMRTTRTSPHARALKQLEELRDRLSDGSVPPFRDTSLAAQKKRHADTRDDTGRFKQVFAPHYAENPDAGFHADLDAALEWPVREVHGIHGPRDHGKSSHHRMGLLRKILNGQVQFWLFISETLGLAVDHCSFLVEELERNPRIRSDYDVRVQIKNESRGIYQFRITCHATGQAHDVRLLALSYGTPVKGKLFRARRPDGATLDDFESTKTSRNPEIGAEKQKWVRQEVYPAVRGPILWFGNTGRATSALYLYARHVYRENDRALKAALRAGTTPGDVVDALETERAEKRQGNTSEAKSASARRSRSRRKVQKAPDRKPKARLRFWSFRATTPLDDGEIRYLWPEAFTPAEYAEAEATMGPRIWSGEMNGEPIAEGKVFKAEWFPTYKRLPNGCRLYLWCDPAFGKSKSACYKAVVVVATDGKRYYVVDAWVRQTEPVSAMIAGIYALFELHDERGLRDGGYESDFGQEDRLADDFEDAAEREGWPLPVSSDSNTGAKDARIESLEPIMSTSRLLWPHEDAAHPHSAADVQTVKDQLLGYPNDFDDGPDALESGLRRIRWTRGSKPLYQSLGGRRFGGSRASRARR